jgi:aminopeptidase N
VTGTDPYLPGHGDARYAVEHYDLDLAYKPSGNHLEGTAVLRLRALEPLDVLELDLYRLRVRDVRVEGAKLKAWTHRRSRLRLRLAGEVGEQESLEVRVRYSGNPRPMPGPDGPAGWEELTDGVIVAAQPHGAPSWFPCNDRMDDKARYRIAVTTDPAYHVVANGRLTERSRAGRLHRWVHEHDEPMAPYLATLQIGRYTRDRPLGQSRVDVSLVAAPTLISAARAATADQTRMLAVFEDLFGPYPFESYTVVVTEDPLEIPLESQTLSTFGRNHLSADWEAQRLIAHELAHQWFGNTVTAGRLADIWLHEGFACYAEWLWSEASGVAGADDQADRHHARLAAAPQDLVLTDPGAKRTFDDRVYKRGALTLHVLRRHVGDDRFFELLRRWVSDHRYGNASTADFENLVLQHFGEPALELIRPWLHERPLPGLRGQAVAGRQGEDAAG